MQHDDHDDLDELGRAKPTMFWHPTCSMVTTMTSMRSSWAKPTKYSYTAWYAPARISRTMIDDARPAVE